MYYSIIRIILEIQTGSLLLILWLQLVYVPKNSLMSPIHAWKRYYFWLCQVIVILDLVTSIVDLYAHNFLSKAVIQISESSNSAAALMSEEEILLVQVIKSIMAIINQDPQSHERVSLSISSYLFCLFFIHFFFMSIVHSIYICIISRNLPLLIFQEPHSVPTSGMSMIDIRQCTVKQ